MFARCPASTSNLGPGFDVLSLALGLYVDVNAKPAPQLEIRARGQGEEYPRDESHLCAAVARSVVGHDRFSFEIASEIPVGRGLGSSAALALATAAALGAEDPFGVASAFDGHAENAAASMYGGLNAAAMIDGQPLAMRLPLDDALAFVLVIPDRELSTKKARSVLPTEVAFTDAVMNLGRMGLLLAGLFDHEQLVPAAGVDRLHQGARTALFPESTAILARLQAAGATVACWSGAGPALLGICADADLGPRVRDAGEQALVDVGLAGRSLVLVPDYVGLVVAD